MSFSRYVRLSVWEMLLVCVAAVSLTYTLLDSFYIAPALQYSPAPGVAAVVLTLALFMSAFNGRTARIGGALIAVACVAFVAVAISFSPSAFMADTEETYFYFAVVCVVGPLLTFGLSRQRWGTAVLFGAGSFVCAWMQFFYGFNELAWTILFVVSSLMLIIFKNYQLSARTATSVRRLSFSAGFGVSAVAVAVSVGLACGVWFGIIAPLGPEALDIKLITEYRALETYLVKGTSSVEMMPNMDLTSDQTIDQERTTDDLLESEDGRQMSAPEDMPESGEEQESGSFLGIDLESLQENFDILTYEEDEFPTIVLLPILLLVLIVAYFVGRRIHRSWKLGKIQKESPDEQVRQIYLLLMRKMRRIGYVVPEGVTLLEYARNNEQTLKEFQDVSGVSFGQLTTVYVRKVYGKKPVSEGEALMFSDYYRGFWKAARKKLGNVKYFFKSFGL